MESIKSLFVWECRADRVSQGYTKHPQPIRDETQPIRDEISQLAKLVVDSGFVALTGFGINAY